MIKMDVFYNVIFHYDIKYCYYNIIIITFIIVYLRKVLYGK